MRAAVGIAFFFALCFSAWGDQPAIRSFSVTALAADGSPIRSGPAFPLEADKVICSYSVIEKADGARFEWAGGQVAANRVIAYSDVLNFAVLRTEEEITVEPASGISTIFSIGDAVYFFEREDISWKTFQGTIVGFEDSGVDLTLIHLRPESEAERFLPSPVINTAGEFVGWLSEPGAAITPETLYRWMGDSEGVVTLAEISHPNQIWTYLRIAPNLGEHFPEFHKLTVVTGTRAFPFRMEIPESWEYEGVNFAGRHFFRAKDSLAGLCLDLHILPVQMNDLQTAIERMETIQFAELSRSEFIPYDAGHITGFRARYDDIGSALSHSATVFYGISKRLFYVLSVSYPANLEDKIRPFIDHILSSFEPVSTGAQ